MRTGKKFQGLRAGAAFAEDPSSFPSTHVRQFTTVRNSSFRALDHPFWPPRAPDSHVHTFFHPTQAHTRTHTHH